jgi:tetratricopeptide (TPR) repeat protein
MRVIWAAVAMLMLASTAHAVPPVFLEQSDSQKAKAAADAYRVDEAVALYTKVLESPNLTSEERAAALTGRAEARENYTVAHGLKDSEMMLALADYQQARKLWRTSRTLGNEAGAFIILGGYPEATAAFREAVPLERPEPHWSLIGLARVQRIQGHYDEAMKHLDEALRFVEPEGGTMPVYYHRGRVFYLAGKFAEAADAVTKGIPIQPDYAFARKLRACAYAQLGDYTKAHADAEESVKLFLAAPLDEAWSKTPYGQATMQDFRTNDAAIKAMAEGKDVEANRAKLCKNTWNDGEDKRDRSPLLPAPAT